jgi:hypothetical protein
LLYHLAPIPTLAQPGLQVLSKPEADTDDQLECVGYSLTEVCDGSGAAPGLGHSSILVYRTSCFGGTGTSKPDYEEVSAALHLQHGVLRLPILLNPKRFPEPQVAYSSHSGITNPRSPTHGGAFDDDPSGHEDISG